MVWLVASAFVKLCGWKHTHLAAWGFSDVRPDRQTDRAPTDVIREGVVGVVDAVLLDLGVWQRLAAHCGEDEYVPAQHGLEYEGVAKGD